MKDVSVEIEGLVSDKVFVKVKNDLLITEDIDTEVDHASANFGYYAVLSEKAETRYQKLKYAFERWKAEFGMSIDAERVRDGAKKLTEKQKEECLITHEKFKAYQLKMIKLDDDRRTLKILAKAFEKKADLIQTKSSNRRKEIRGS